MAIAAPGEHGRTVTILGVTGSVGCNTVRLLQESAETFCVEAVTAHRNAALLAQHAKALRAKLAVIGDPLLLPALREHLQGTDIETAAGEESVVEAAERPAEWVMAAIVGSAGLAPTLAAVRRGATIALANKECLVCAGDLIMQDAKTSGARIIPVDSEHSAIFQVFDYNHPETIEHITLTASGGPFRTWTQDAIRHATPAQAVNHPNWQMGTKISVDSATMMNKGLEVIEAYHLFPITAEQIQVIVHPESIIHSMVNYTDGSVLAQLGTPDMSTPIAVALAWPERMVTKRERLNLAEIRQLTFEDVDTTRFPALNLARQALVTGGSAPTVLNAANEIAVEAFIAGAIGFLDIPAIVEETLASLPTTTLTSLESILNADQEARDVALSFIARQRKRVMA